MDYTITKIPQECPGTSNENSGKASACDGCPNQKICSTGSNQIDPDVLKYVKKKIIILSGKGGVGKSTFTSQLAWALSEDENYQVGLMDIDICGPSIPKILGIEDEPIHQSGSGLVPVYPKDNLAVISVGFLLENKDDAIIWRGPKKNNVDWGQLDCLLIDTPPGTSDEHLSLTTFLKESGIDGAIIITTPQEVSLQDVRKEIDFCYKVGLRIIGVVENMSNFVCPHCQPSNGGAQQLIKDFSIPFLGSIPLDPLLGKCCDEGLSIFEKYPTSEIAKSYLKIVQSI